MKKTAFILAFLTCGLLSMAQSTTYRQNLEQTISHIVVSGNCIVCLEQDTCNWISYTASAPSTKERLVVIEGNRLTTTAAANDMTLHVGTTPAHLRHQRQCHGSLRRQGAHRRTHHYQRY